MTSNTKSKREIIRVRGRLRELVTLQDASGKILHRILNPLMLEFYGRDVMQVIIGASILAVPVAFTEETWNLGQTLPMMNILLLLLVSITFISTFVFYNYYKNDFRQHWPEFLKRVISTYTLSLFVVALILTLINRAPWTTDALLAIKRTILVALPASMSAAISDMIK
jgi:uncharacterized membrane protein